VGQTELTCKDTFHKFTELSQWSKCLICRSGNLGLLRLGIADTLETDWSPATDNFFDVVLQEYRKAEFVLFDHGKLGLEIAASSQDPHCG
jgi:hypothetical protein